MKSGCEDRKALNQESRRIAFPETLLTKPVGIRKSKTSRWRAAALILLNLLMVAHVIQWWIVGRTVSPIEPSETMHTLQRGAVNAGFIFFSLAILATLIFGRFVCGWGCHILALQDFCAWMLKKIGLTPKPFRSRLLISRILAEQLVRSDGYSVCRRLQRKPYGVTTVTAPHPIR